MDYDIDSRVELEESDRVVITKAIEAVLDTEGIDGEGEVSISIVSSDDIRELNRDYRGIDKTTDVLSFPQYNSIDEILDEDYKMIGDIVINMDKVISQAKEYKTGRKRELAYLTIHSMYHLLGFDHIDENDKKEMRSREELAYNNMGEI